MKTIDEERYIFRCIEQRTSESIESFVSRLQNQIVKCAYQESELDERLKEQIIKKCSNKKLQEISFQLKLNLKDLISTAKVLEAEKVGESSKMSTKPECSRCGFTDHIGSDQSCPAKRGHACELCGHFGHYARMCKKSKNSKRPNNVDKRGWKIPKLSEKLPEKPKEIQASSTQKVASVFRSKLVAEKPKVPELLKTPKLEELDENVSRLIKTRQKTVPSNGDPR